MFLAYLVHHRESARLTVHTVEVGGRQGAPLGRDRFPRDIAMLLKAPPPSITLKPLDRRILMKLMMHRNRGAHEVSFAGRDAFTVLSDMIETGRCYLFPGAAKALRWGKPVRAKPRWRIAADTGRWKPVFEVEGDPDVLPCAPPVAVAEARMACHRLVTPFPDELAHAWQMTVPMDADACAIYIERLTRQYPRVAVPPPAHLPETRIDDATPAPVLTVRRDGTGGGATLFVSLAFLYGAREIAAGDAGERVRYVHENVLYDMGRNPVVEMAAAGRLADYGFVPCDAAAGDLFAAAEKRAALTLSPVSGVTWTQVHQSLLPDLAGDGWRIRHDRGCALVAPGDEDWYTDFDASGKGWMTFETGIRVDGRQVNLLPFLYRFLRECRGWSQNRFEEALTGTTVPVPTDTCVALIPGERMLAMVLGLFELYGEDPLDKTNRLRVDEWRAAELAVARCTGGWQPPPAIRALVRSVAGALDIAPMPAPAGMAVELRPYQEYGLGWLSFLRDQGLGGILADDMGLGKTVQAIALLQREKNAGRLDLPALVVGPTSVLPNWRRELQRFAPGLRVRVLHGPDRHAAMDDFTDTDVVVTSYALLRRDQAVYARQVFAVAILDEAQAIKNPAAQVTGVACALNARLRLCLTGTPVENHLGELWSLFNFALPGFLGTELVFQRVFRRPIEDEAHPIVRGVLQRRIRPLSLRRTKDRVAAELPPKTEMVRAVPLSDVQADIYQTIRVAMTARVREEMADKGLARSRIVILDALLKLRQTCCDPRLRDRRRAYTLPDDSAKLKLLSEMLPEMVEEGRRILLFSQFTSMLDLIRELVDGLGIPYVELRGSTRDRDTPVRAFQTGDIPLFLISLKAGGTGINLTAADTVIHYDPWWNPAVETQATDRAHRIGQDKPVFVYKLVTSGTIEERMLELQEKKRSLMQLIEGKTAETLTFTEEDLDMLLAPVGER